MGFPTQSTKNLLDGLWITLLLTKLSELIRLHCKWEAALSEKRLAPSFAIKIWRRRGLTNKEALMLMSGWSVAEAYRHLGKRDAKRGAPSGRLNGNYRNGKYVGR